MTTLKGVFPDPRPMGRKNFIQENVKSVRRMEQCFHSNKEMEELQKLHLCKQNKTAEKYQNVTARINTSSREKKYESSVPALKTNSKKNEEKLNRKSSAPVFSKNGSCRNTSTPVKQKRRDKRPLNKPTHKLKEKILSDPNLSQNRHVRECCSKSEVKYKSQAIQTLDTNVVDDIYSEGLIKYASENLIHKTELIDINQSNEHGGDSIREIVPPASGRGDEGVDEVNLEDSFKSTDFLAKKHDVDFVKLNKERSSMASRIATHLNNNGILPSNYRKGVVPKYIKERKEAQEKEQREKAVAVDPACPKGHIALPDSERKDTLKMLKKNYQDYVTELNKMPIKSDTLRAQRRKIEIEKQLNKLEEGIKVFSRPKVYVKVDA